MGFREGDFIETTERLIFDVKGLVHPPGKVVAFIRYIPDPEGDRERCGLRYRKVYELSERYDFLREEYPQYLVYDNVFDEFLSEVSLEKVAFHYKPQEKTFELQRSSDLKDVERQTLEFINFVSESAGVSVNDIGVSGSVLVGLFSRSSDIDLVIYGVKNCIVVHDALRKLLDEGVLVKAYDLDVLMSFYKVRHRDTGVSFDEYVFHELRKSFQGYFKGRGYFVRYVKDWDEVTERYGEIYYKTVGYVKIKGRVVDDSNVIFTPCTYILDDVEVIEGRKLTPIKEIASFRGRFCEQAKTGEEIMAQGKLERVDGRGKHYYRLLLGNSSRDFMITVNK